MSWNCWKYVVMAFSQTMQQVTQSSILDLQYFCETNQKIIFAVFLLNISLSIKFIELSESSTWNWLLRCFKKICLGRNVIYNINLFFRKWNLLKYCKIDSNSQSFHLNQTNTICYPSRSCDSIHIFNFCNFVTTQIQVLTIEKLRRNFQTWKTFPLLWIWYQVFLL